MDKTTLYGSSLSLYTGRARSYLIKAGIPYEETIPNSAHFLNTVLPQMGGRQSIPTIELASGEVIRDGAAILEHFELLSDNRFSPKAKAVNVLSLLFDVIGSEGLLRPAMHYRWNFPDHNDDFLQFHFETFIPQGMNKREMATKRMNQMRSAGQAFGAVPDTYELIENLYTDLLIVLNEHFAQYPYLLGSNPSIGDFGLIAPMFGHLGRDPKPLSIMQSKAINVFRWVERMNRPDADIGEFTDQAQAYFDADNIPSSLERVLKQIAIDFVPESQAACKAINLWLEQQSSLPSGTIVERGVGMCTFEVNGQMINALAQPYRFYLLERFQQAYQTLNENDQSVIDLVLAKSHMTALLDLSLDRKIGRENNREVWL